MNQQPVGQIQVSEIQGDFRRLGHGAADQGYLASIFSGHFHRQLNAMDGRRKAGDEDAARTAREDLVELAPYGALARRVAGPLDVGRVLEEGQNALFAVFGEGVQIEQFAIGAETDRP